MALDRPEEFRFDTGYGIVLESYPDWHVDILTAGGGVIQRAMVLGPRLPEKSTDARPQWVYFGFADHSHSQAWCVPQPSRLPGDRSSRKDFVYYEEVGNYRITIDRTGVLEIRNTVSAEVLQQIRIFEADEVVRIDTPTTRAILDNKAKSITFEADETVTVNCKNAIVNTEEDTTVNAEGNVAVDAGGNVDIQAGVNATIAAGGNISVEAGGTLDLTATGAVTISGATVDIN